MVMEPVIFAQCGTVVLRAETQNTDHEKSDCKKADCQQKAEPALQGSYLRHSRLGMVSSLGYGSSGKPLRAVFGFVVLKRT